METLLRSALLASPPLATGVPTYSRVRSFIARVEQADYLGAVVHFYHADAWFQENMDPPRKGRDAQLAYAMETMLRYGKLHTRKVERFAINGSLVFINWQIEVMQPNGEKVLFDEVAMQEWDGERIRWERFYYDPGQFSHRAAT